MFLKFIDFASHRPVTSEFVNFDNISLTSIETIENYQFLALDIKKWRIALIFVAFKNDDS